VLLLYSSEALIMLKIDEKRETEDGWVLQRSPGASYWVCASGIRIPELLPGIIMSCAYHVAVQQ